MSVKMKRVKPTVQGNPGPSGRGRDLEQGYHPLQNDLILKTLFGFVRRYDLIACRVVSKKWNIHTMPQMRSKFKVTIRGSQTSSKKGEDTRRIQNFVELFNSNEFGIPFSKFQLGPFCTTEGVGQQFLQLCGETATEIDLNEVNDGKSEVYTIEHVSELLRSCPNMQVLDFPDRLISGSKKIVKLFPGFMPTFCSLQKITFRTDFEKGRFKYCPTSIEELLTAAPNITNISVSDNFDEDGGNAVESISDIGVLLTVIEKLGMESSIQSLFLEKAKKDKIEHLERLAKKGLKLKSLTLESCYEHDLDTVQIQLATYFKDSLQYLNVEESVDNILMAFPNMPELKSLTLIVYDDIYQAPVNLNIYFPALETLNIAFDGINQEISDWDEFFSEFEPCPTLKSLIVGTENMRIHTFHTILRVFPNLTKFNLQIGVDGVEILRAIWSQMTGLESITIRGYIERKEKNFLDSLFTGIPARTLKEISPDVNGVDTLTAQNRREAIEYYHNHYSQLPSIRNLTKLRHLDLDVSGGVNCQNWEHRGEIHLTDLTAYLVLYSLNHLSHLSLKQCDLTKTCCELLTKETGLESWSFRNIESKDIIPPFVRQDREKHYN